MDNLDKVLEDNKQDFVEMQGPDGHGHEAFKVKPERDTYVGGGGPQPPNESRLRGKGLATGKKESRLRGKGLAKRTEPLPHPAETASTPVAEHAPTWDLTLGKYGTGYGSLERDGFEARNSNHSSNQDAFAVSEDQRRFAVADGMGGYGAADPEGTAFLARFMADRAVQKGVDTLLDPGQLRSAYQAAADALGRPFNSPRFRGKMVGRVGTTLTFTEILGSDRVRIVAIGDSPAFITDRDGNIVQQFGEDAQSGETDISLAYKLGIDTAGNPLLPQKREVKGGRSIVDTIVTVPEGGKVVLGSDYFSDLVAARGKAGKLSDFIGIEPEEFSRRTRAIGKHDDATLITIDPAIVARHE